MTIEIADILNFLSGFITAVLALLTYIYYRDYYASIYNNIINDLIREKKIWKPPSLYLSGEEGKSLILYNIMEEPQQEGALEELQREDADIEYFNELESAYIKWYNNNVITEHYTFRLFQGILVFIAVILILLSSQSMIDFPFLIILTAAALLSLGWAIYHAIQVIKLSQHFHSDSFQTDYMEMYSLITNSEWLPPHLVRNQLYLSTLRISIGGVIGSLLGFIVAGPIGTVILGGIGGFLGIQTPGEKLSESNNSNNT